MHASEVVVAKKSNRWLIFLVSFAFGLIIAGATGGAIAMNSFTPPSARITPIVTEPIAESNPELPAEPAQGSVTIAALVLPPPPPPPEAISAFSTPYNAAPSVERTTAQLLGL
jgi:hypothetical protein